MAYLDNEEWRRLAAEIRSRVSELRSRANKLASVERREALLAAADSIEDTFYDSCSDVCVPAGALDLAPGEWPDYVFYDGRKYGRCSWIFVCDEEHGIVDCGSFDQEGPLDGSTLFCPDLCCTRYFLLDFFYDGDAIEEFAVISDDVYFASCVEAKHHP
jgi:hypothetical protein